MPHEPEQWMDFQMLSWLTLEKSRKIRFPELQQEAASLTKETIAAAREQIAAQQGNGATKIDRLIGHDKLTLLKHGIAAWSYGDAITPEDLDVRTADWAAREIINFSEPSDDDLKKESSRATDS